MMSAIMGFKASISKLNLMHNKPHNRFNSTPALENGTIQLTEREQWASWSDTLFMCFM